MAELDPSQQPYLYLDLLSGYHHHPPDPAAHSTLALVPPELPTYDPYYYTALAVAPAATEHEHAVAISQARFVATSQRMHQPPLGSPARGRHGRRGRRISYADSDPEYSPPRKKKTKAKSKAAPSKVRASERPPSSASSRSRRAPSPGPPLVNILHAGPDPVIDTVDGPFRLLDAHARLLDPPPNTTLDGSDLLIINAPGTHSSGSVFEVYTCRVCYKAYDGRNARSVARRHLQDKHGVKLEWQKRRTRWESVNPVRPAEVVRAQRERVKTSKREYAQRVRLQLRIEREHASYLESFGPRGLRTFAGVDLVAPRFKAQHPDATGGCLDGHADGIILPSDLRADIAALKQLLRAEVRGGRPESPLPVLREELGSDADGEGEDEQPSQGTSTLDDAIPYVPRLQPALELVPPRRRATISGAPAARPVRARSSTLPGARMTVLSSGSESSDHSDSDDDLVAIGEHVALPEPTHSNPPFNMDDLTASHSQQWTYVPYTSVGLDAPPCATPAPAHRASPSCAPADSTLTEVAEQLLQFRSSPTKPAASSAPKTSASRRASSPDWNDYLHATPMPTAKARTPARRPLRQPFVAHRPDAPHRSLSSVCSDDPFLASPAQLSTTKARGSRADPPSSPVRPPLGVLRANTKTPKAAARDSPGKRAAARWQLSSPGDDFAATLGLAPHALPATPGLGLHDMFSHGTPVPRGRV
ncbi:hypothetical protein Q5752_000301 [Cryptotrichosporon argae]